jgi:hypothetical protein
MGQLGTAIDALADDDLHALSGSTPNWPAPPAAPNSPRPPSTTG